MGIDFDFQSHLSRNKLTASQYQQPRDQLDQVTQSTQRPNIQQLLRILNLIERRFGNNQNQMENPLAVLISFADNRRIVITFGPMNQEAMRANNQPNRLTNHLNLIRPRMMRQEQNEQLSLEGINERQMRVPEQLSRVRRIPQMPILPRLPNLGRQIRQIQHEAQQQNQERLFHQPLQHLSPMRRFHRHQHRHRLQEQPRRIPNFNQQERLGNQNQIQNQRSLYMSNQSFQRRISANQVVVNQRENIQNQRIMHNDDTLTRINPEEDLNKAKRKNERGKNRPINQDDGVSCWRSFTNMLRNLFRRIF